MYKRIKIKRDYRKLLKCQRLKNVKFSFKTLAFVINNFLKLFKNSRKNIIRRSKYKFETKSKKYS